jgi:hypothetical protein
VPLDSQGSEVLKRLVGPSLVDEQAPEHMVA